MSTGADCYFMETAPGIWKYKIQLWPYGEWEEYNTHGPFTSFGMALKHLDENYANPGGWRVLTNKERHVHEFEADYCISCGYAKKQEK